MLAIGGALARRGGADEVARPGIVLAAAFRSRRAVSPQADAFRRDPRGPDHRLGSARPCICPASILPTNSFDTPPTVSRWPDLPVIPRARRRGAGWPSDGCIARRCSRASVRRRRRRNGSEGQRGRNRGRAIRDRNCAHQAEPPRSFLPAVWTDLRPPASTASRFPSAVERSSGV